MRWSENPASKLISLKGHGRLSQQFLGSLESAAARFTDGFTCPGELADKASSGQRVARWWRDYPENCLRMIESNQRSYLECSSRSSAMRSRCDVVWGWVRWCNQPKPRTVPSIISLFGFVLRRFRTWKMVASEPWLATALLHRERHGALLKSAHGSALRKNLTPPTLLEMGILQQLIGSEWVI